MQTFAPPALDAAAKLRPRGQARVAVASLGVREQRVVHALRAVCAGSQGRSLAREPLPTAASAVGAALERYACELLRDEDDLVAAAAIEDSAYLTTIEAHTLQAIACMQAGLLGEAWKALAAICSPGRAGDALIALEQVAAATVPAGPSILA